MSIASVSRTGAWVFFVWLGATSALNGQGPLDQPQAGWPLTATGFDFPAAPLVADLDGDGADELVVPALDRLTVFSGDGTPWPGWPWIVPAGPDLSFLSGRVPAVGDVTGDGVPEIVVTGRKFDVLVFDLAGQLLPGWPQSVTVTPFDGEVRALVADMTGDGIAEVVAQGLSGQPGSSWAIWVFRGDGTPLPGWPVSLGPEFGFGGFSVGDVDFDGDPEIAVTAINLGMYGVAPSPTYIIESSGETRDGWPVTPEGSSYARAAQNPIIADIDGDFLCEVVGAGLPYLHSFRADGTEYAGPSPTPGGFLPAAVANLDDDPRLEVVVPGHDLRVVDPYLGVSAIFDLPAGRFIRVAIADVNGDGRFEIAAMAETPAGARVFLFDQDLVLLPGWPIELPLGVYSNQKDVSFGDLDGDGDLELVYSTGWEIYAIDLANPGGGPLEKPWPMTYHDPSGSGFYHYNAVPPNRFLRGDLDGDGTLQLSDVLQLFGLLFQGQEHACPRQADINSDQVLDISDGVYVLSYLFLGPGFPVAPPFPDCEVASGSDLPCRLFVCP